jgi:hypothetical protein
MAKGPIVLEPNKEIFELLKAGIHPGENVYTQLHKLYDISTCPVFDETEFLGPEVHE